MSYWKIHFFGWYLVPETNIHKSETEKTQKKDLFYHQTVINMVLVGCFWKIHFFGWYLVPETNIHKSETEKTQKKDLFYHQTVINMVLVGCFSQHSRLPLILVATACRKAFWQLNLNLRHQINYQHMSVIEQIVIIWLLYVHGVKLYWDNDFFSVEP